MAPSPPTPTAPKTIADFFARPAKRLRACSAAPAASLSSSPSSLSPEQRRRADTNLALARARRNLRLAESKVQATDGRCSGCGDGWVPASGGAPKLEELLVEETWAEALHGELRKPCALELCRFVAHERLHGPLPVYPPPHLVFHALNATPFDRVKAVIIGQDPYHGPGQAMGLSFSVPEGIKIPSSLGNIFKELEKDLGCTVPSHGNLERWAVQGVLMLNTVLTGRTQCRELPLYAGSGEGCQWQALPSPVQREETATRTRDLPVTGVREHQANSHAKKGWEQFTDAVIKTVSQKKSGLVFLLWGNSAQSKTRLIDETKHHILKSAHPSGLSANRGFFGCRHFSKTNQILEKLGLSAIDWQL
ncbi:uracil-DNA glycosylase, mitochondrial-like isoform X4 [Miscanthus floridulus]|uniref:uracil-DNA glycosylase, mitochondrial-like isoform X4 n=1 Tax=Miscanthus floridulus TaxID=154761 RepID=UPI0034588830